MSQEAEILVQRYIDAAERHAGLIEAQDSKAANKAYHAKVRALHDLDKYDAEGRRRLVAYLGHPNAYVRSTIACHLLELFPNQAEAALEEIAPGRGAAALDAMFVLKEWRKGTLKIP